MRRPAVHKLILVLFGLQLVTSGDLARPAQAAGLRARADAEGRFTRRVRGLRPDRPGPQSQIDATGTEMGSFQRTLRHRPTGAALQSSTNRVRSQYRVFRDIGPRDNREFIKHKRFAERHDRPWLFYTSELVSLKELNDRHGDKGLITALANMYKQTLLDVLDERRFRGLRNSWFERYSDFKTVCFAFSADSPEIRRQVQEFHEAVGHRFAEKVTEEGLAEHFEGLSGLAGQVGSWHLGGIGRTADAAALAARFTRHAFDGAGLPRDASRAYPRISTFEAVADDAYWKLERAGVLRRRIVGSLPSGSPLLQRVDVGNGAGITLSRAAIAAIRQTRVEGRPLAGMAGRDAYLTALSAQLAQHFAQEQPALELTREQVSDIAEYHAAVDAFSASLFMEKRVIVPWERAKDQVISVDFAGQGVRNHFETQRGLMRVEALMAPRRDWRMEPRQAVEAALSETRAAEARATAQMQGDMVHFRRAVRTAAERSSPGPRWRRLGWLGRLLRKGKAVRESRRVHFSGDDGVYFPSAALSSTGIDSLMKQLATRDPARFRTVIGGTHVDTGVGRHRLAADSALIQRFVDGEGLEKALRKRLHGKLTLAELAKALIAIELHPQSSEASGVRLHVFGQGLSEHILDAIRQAFDEEQPGGAPVERAGSKEMATEPELSRVWSPCTRPKPETAGAPALAA